MFFHILFTARKMDNTQDHRIHSGWVDVNPKQDQLARF